MLVLNVSNHDLDDDLGRTIPPGRTLDVADSSHIRDMLDAKLLRVVDGTVLPPAPPPPPVPVTLNIDTSGAAVGRPLVFTGVSPATLGAGLNPIPQYPHVAPNGAAFAGGGVVIHYDDGYASVHQIAAPLHAELGIPGVNNINSGYIDGGNTGKQTWNDVRDLQASGMWVSGNHTRDHVSLTGLTTAQVRDQIESCYHRIFDETGIPPLWFAAPFHGYNKAIEVVTSRLHVKARTAATNGSAPARSFLYGTRSDPIPVDAARLPNGLADLPALLDSLYYETVIRGSAVHVYLHEITPTHVDNGTSNVGLAVYQAFIQGLRDRHIPVLDPRALTYPRLNMLDDGSFEMGGRDWTLSTANGTPVVADDTADAHSGVRYMRLPNLGAAGNGPNVTSPRHYVPVENVASWRVSFWARGPRTTGCAIRYSHRRLRELSGMTSSFTDIAGTAGTAFAAANTWQLFTYTVDMTGYAGLELYFEARVSDAAPATIDVDSVSLSPAFTYDMNGETV